MPTHVDSSLNAAQRLSNRRPEEWHQRQDAVLSNELDA
jgi:hypothetical protein